MIQLSAVLLVASLVLSVLGMSADGSVWFFAFGTLAALIAGLVLIAHDRGHDDRP